MANPAEDLDAFLTTVELKLRGPFSSLELTKTAQTVGLRKHDDSAPVEFLERLAQVLHRTDKITKLRILIGLLGFDPDHGELDAQIEAILTDAQETSKHEEWVRVVAGLIQGIMFDEEGEDSKECRRSCRGEEARDLLEKTCRAIIENVQEVEQRTEVMDASEHPRILADADPTFAPFRYALLRPEVVEQIFPKDHGYFTVNRSSDLLTMDAKQDALKAQEEKEHETIPGMGAIANESKAATAAVKETLTPSFPGFRSASSKNKSTTGVQRPKSSMFITSKKPAAVAAKTVLHQRRVGAAQALVGKGRGRMVGASGRAATLVAGSSVAGVRGRAMQGTARTRMKMVDDEEANVLSTNQQQQTATSPPLSQQGKLGRKRKGDAIGNDSAKVAKRGNDTTAVEDNSKAAVTESTGKVEDALAAAALHTYQTQKASAVTAPAVTADSPEKTPAADKTAGAHHRQQDWRSLLENKSNKLSSEDRSRVEQFFVDHSNPTPDQTQYKMKLHEERTNDPATGQPMKETYYLELDYTNFTSKQSKKVKRY